MHSVDSQGRSKAKSELSVMTVEEVAAYLRIPQSSVYKLAQEGRIPCKKVGRRWRFHQKVIDEWLSGNASRC
jgi:excisionase family DNA binding protein